MLPESLFRHLGLTGREARLPPRVADLIIKEEERSELLIAWVQIAVVLTFAALYFLTPRPVDAMDLVFEPVPIVLEIFLAFAIVRLVLTYRGFLPGWFLVLSMVADVVLLYALIWSFHIAYDQPAAFYLKAPTFAYIFVFIAVRALRFDPRFVLSQGLFAAAGWVAMVAFVVETSGPEVITRSFTAYLTENLVLIGAEFDKVFVLVTVTTILSLALWRARQTLIAAVTEGAASTEMRRYFGSGVAEAITGREVAAQAGDVEDRDAAILMLDLRGFSRYAATNAARDVVAALTDYHRLVVPIIAQEGGVVDKFLGDGVMATFGAVRPRQTAAADALNALHRIVEASQEWDAARRAEGREILSLNGAVVSGRVLAATLGDDQRLEFTVIGSAANLAAKLEKYNKVVGTRALTTAFTVEAARAQGYSGQLRSLGETDVPGVNEPVELMVLA